MKSVHAPTFGPLLLRRAQVVLNRWIAQSSAAQQQLRDLEGCSMIVDVDKAPWRIMLSVDDAQARLRQVDAAATADIIILAGVAELLALMRASSLAQMSGGEIEFRGSLRVAEQFSRLLRLARPQLEDELSAWIGGTPARALVQAGDIVLGWGNRTAGALQANAAEYLQAESRELPRPREISEHFAEVERLRDGVERLIQRVDRLSVTTGLSRRSGSRS